MVITLRRLFRNYFSLAGGIIAAISFLVDVFLLFLDYVRPTQNPYVGIITFMVLPGVTMSGLGIVVGGAILRFFQLRREAQVVELPRLDLNNTRHRLALAGTFLALVVFMTLSAVGGYESYHYTDSVAFCGRTCHTVMEPEFTAYQNSPHARVPCVSCHIGPGAEWFVRAKISGAYQVYSVLFNKFSRPIPTPVHNLRPAQDVCEQCHWPAKFWGEQLASRVHFSSDEKNTRREVDLLLKTGGGTEVGSKAGIHYHMNIQNKIWYAAADERRQVIPWVRSEGPDGRVTEYVSTEKPFTPEQLKNAEIRRMDCVDCHNRPSHRYLPPGRALDPALEAGRISPELPYIKKVAVEAMVTPYATAAEADRGIETSIQTFYQKEYPAMVRGQGEKLRAAVEEVKRIYHANFFPEMQVNWLAYPDNIGHKEFPGCFRCHEGKHASADGRMISRQCDACHEFLGRRGEGLMRVAATPAFAHPWKLAGKHTEIRCGECHTGGPAKPATCAGCHGLPTAGPMSGMQCQECHRQDQQVEPVVGCGTCHATAAGLHGKKDHGVAGCPACHAPHLWSPEPRKTCLTCHADKEQHNPGPPCAECHEFRAAAGAADPKGARPPIAFPSDPGSPGKVTFDHALHLARGATCASCHPTVFAMKKGSAKLTMDDMGEGQTCGACHDGQKAFGVMDGDKCTACHGA
ncbi:MAG: cytochrome c3 family protein [candidate division NC10 bacterium]|nr:cytochrome c3 family protein [candidate division NC10 bacterium]